MALNFDFFLFLAAFPACNGEPAGLPTACVRGAERCRNTGRRAGQAPGRCVGKKFFNSVLARNLSRSVA